MGVGGWAAESEERGTGGGSAWHRRTEFISSEGWAELPIHFFSLAMASILSLSYAYKLFRDDAGSPAGADVDDEDGDEDMKKALVNDKAKQLEEGTLCLVNHFVMS